MVVIAFLLFSYYREENYDRSASRQKLSVFSHQQSVDS